MEFEEGLAAIKLLSVRGVGRVTANRVLRAIGEAAVRLSDIQMERVDSREISPFLSKDQVSAFIQQDDSHDKKAEQLEELGASFVSIVAAEYPGLLRELLGDDAPPLLTLVGNSNLLDDPSVGFCGARNASELGIQTAIDCAEQLASLDIVIVSGNAAGVDKAAHFAALQAGGKTILVLPEGILHFRIKSELREVWDWDNVLVLSEFQPGLPWHRRQAMQRNRTIIGLSLSTIVIEAGVNGGTMDAGRTTLNLHRPLYVAEYEDVPETAYGNSLLISSGGRPLRRNKQSGRAAVKDLVDEVLQEQARRGPAAEQLKMRLT